MVFLSQLLEDSLGGRLDVGMMSKEAVALGYIDVPKLTGPVIHVTEKMAVNGAQVRQIEVAFNGTLCEFIGTGRCIIRLVLLQDSGIVDPEIVPENTGIGVKVVVFVRNYSDPPTGCQNSALSLSLTA